MIDALRASEEARSGLTQVLGLQASLAMGRLRKAIQMGNRREIEWEARSLEKIFSATGSSELSHQLGELAGLAGSGRNDDVQVKWEQVQKGFEEGGSRRAA